MSYNNISRSQNITFLVEPGMYNLSTVLAVSNGYNFTMSSTNATVVCVSATARFEFNRVENVYISGMTFQGCRNRAAVQMLRVTRAMIDASHFQYNGRTFYTERASAIYAFYSKLLINKSVFSNNIAYRNYGGAIYALYSNITVERSEFNHNLAYHGGAIYMNNRNGKFELQINSALLYGNRATGGYGGAIYMNNYNGQYIIISFK